MTGDGLRSELPPGLLVQTRSEVLLAAGHYFLDASCDMMLCMNPPQSLFERFIGRPRRRWVPLSAGVLLLLFSLLAAYLDGGFDMAAGQDSRVGVLLPPLIILYIVLVAPPLTRMGSRVVNAFRPLVPLDDKEFDRLTDEAAYIRPRSEIIACGAGVLAGLVTAAASYEAPITWLTVWWYLSTILMYGLLAWIIYGAFADTRLTAALLRQPLHIDLFDTTPFEAIGRQSLVIALVFIGGITLSLLPLAFAPDSFRLLEFWLIYIPLALVPVVIFFLNMYPTHNVLAAARRRELASVRRHLGRACRELVERMAAGQESGNLPVEVNVLVLYEQRLQGVRTWPYNTAMLRTLCLSVLIPIATPFIRSALEALF